MRRIGFVGFAALVLAACAKGVLPDSAIEQEMTRPAFGSTFDGTDAQSILQTYVDAWRGDQEFPLDAPYTIAFWVDFVPYSIELTSTSGTLVNGQPVKFDWGFKTDLSTLMAISEGKMNALTAMGQARSSDPIPLTPKLPEGFDAAKLRNYHIPLLQNFWSRDWPETIPFGDGVTREIHGANTTVLIYDEGLRSAWYQLKPGMHINADPSDQINNFDTAIVVTRGQFTGKIGGVERLFREGETVKIPEGVTHEFYSDDHQYGEFIILMWGEGA